MIYTINKVKNKIMSYLRLIGFKEYGNKIIIKPSIIMSKKNIILGNNIYIGHNSRIEAITSHFDQNFDPIIIIKDGVSIQQNLHLTCASRVEIGKNTAIAANVTITDIFHNYQEIDIPIDSQKLTVTDTFIGDNCKIYNNCVINPGVKIGNQAIIGANSIVTQNIPNYSVAVGNPARVIKKYDFKIKKWIKC